MASKTYSRRLLVEGFEDRRTIPELIEAHGIDWGTRNQPIVYIEALGSCEELLKPETIRTELGLPGLEAVGVLIEADESPERRWQDKANIYTWLAWQDPPGRQIHDAVKQRILEPTHPKAQSFLRWFTTLYNLSLPA